MDDIDISKAPNYIYMRHILLWLGVTCFGALYHGRRQAIKWQKISSQFSRRMWSAVALIDDYHFCLRRKALSNKASTSMGNYPHVQHAKIMKMAFIFDRNAFILPLPNNFQLRSHLSFSNSNF